VLECPQALGGIWVFCFIELSAGFQTNELQRISSGVGRWYDVAIMTLFKMACRIMYYGAWKIGLIMRLLPGVRGPDRTQTDATLDELLGLGPNVRQYSWQLPDATLNSYHLFILYRVTI